MMERDFGFIWTEFVIGPFDWSWPKFPIWPVNDDGD